MARSTPLLALGLTLAVALGACGGSGTGTAKRRAWDPSAVKDSSALAARIAAAGEGCQDYGPYPFQMTKGAPLYTKGLRELPAALGNCQTRGEDSEIATFGTAAQRARYVEDRRAYLCKISDKKHVGFPGFPYVEGPRFTIEPDTQGVARILAPIVDGTEKFAQCHKAQAATWDERAARVGDALAKKVQQAGLGCPTYQLDDYLLAEDYTKKRVPVPEAVVTCAVDGQRAEFIAFGTTRERDAFVTAHANWYCGVLSRQSQTGQYTYVEGPTWVVRATANPDPAATLARKLAGPVGGTLRVVPCGPDATG